MNTNIEVTDMNIKGFIFLICTIFVLVLTINYSVNNNHFLLTRKTNGTFSESLYIKDNFFATEDTKIYLQAFYDTQDTDVEVWIEGKDGFVYQIDLNSEKEVEKIDLPKGMYSFIIKGERGKDTNINTLIGYYTDEVRFINDDKDEEG
jgi:hypothetical protein